jgi:septal ring factor EnvC (AmiA/AmiB activator)
MPAAFVLLSPDEYAGLQARVALSETRISQLEQKMATIAESLANANTQIAELSAAAALIPPFIAEQRAKIAELQALLEAMGNPADVAAAVQAIADSVDTVEKGILAAVTPPAPPPVEPPVEAS